MSEVIGPIAINIVRVFKDVATTLITYGLFLLGFTLGFFMLLYYYIQSKHDLSHDVVDDAAKRAEALQVIAPKVIVQLMFATFNPEEIDWEAINVINNTKAYPNQETDPKKPYKPGSIFGNGHYADFARTFLIAFLLVSVIVLLNVLIAAMNNTGLQSYVNPIPIRERGGGGRLRPPLKLVLTKSRKAAGDPGFLDSHFLSGRIEKERALMLFFQSEQKLALPLTVPPTFDYIKENSALV